MQEVIVDELNVELSPQFQVEARRMRARMRYVADVLRSARRMLDTPEEDGVDGLLLHAIGQLTDGSDEGRCYDCRTTGERLAEIEERLATIERRQLEDADTFGKHARRLDGIDEELGDQTQRLSALEERVSEVERLLKEMSNREQINLRQFLGLAKQVDALEVKAASAAVHLGQVPNVVKRINELDHLVQAVIKDCVAIENRLEVHDARG